MEKYTSVVMIVVKIKLNKPNPTETIYLILSLTRILTVSNNIVVVVFRPFLLNQYSHRES